MYYIINQLNHNSSKIKLSVKHCINLIFSSKFFQINYFYYLLKYKFYRNLNSLKLDKNSTILDFGANIVSVALYLSDIFFKNILLRDITIIKKRKLL